MTNLQLIYSKFNIVSNILSLLTGKIFCKYYRYILNEYYSNGALYK